VLAYNCIVTLNAVSEPGQFIRYTGGLRAGRPVFYSRQGQEIFLFSGSGAHTASYPVGTGGWLPGVKRPGREADHSPPSSAEIKNGGAILA
jgi:hypothetical protein